MIPAMGAASSSLDPGRRRETVRRGPGHPIAVRDAWWVWLGRKEQLDRRHKMEVSQERDQ